MRSVIATIANRRRFFIVVATGLPELFAPAGGGKAQLVASVLLE